MIGWALSRGFSDHNRRLDSRTLIVAGECWTSGRSPYVHEAFATTWRETYGSEPLSAFVFAYPPTLALVAISISLAGVEGGLALFDALNVLALFASFACCIGLMRRWNPNPLRDPRAALGLLFAAAVGAISSTLVLGQTGLLALLALLGAFTLPKERFGALRVACVVLATIKPTLTLPALCFLLVTETALIALAAAVALALCTPVLLASGGPEVLGQWLDALRAYGAVQSNSPLHLGSAHHLLFRFLPAVPTAVLTVAAVVAALLIGARARAARSQSSVSDLLPLLAISAACLPLHDYDMVCMVPLAAMIPFARRASAWLPLGVLMVARPAPLARAFDAVGLHIAYPDAFVMASGTAVLALGFGFLLLTQRGLFADGPSVQLLATSDKAA